MVNVLMAAGLMGGLALVMGKIGQNSAKTQRGARESMEIINFYNQVQKHLLNHNSCKETFSAMDALAVGDVDDDAIYIDSIVSKPDETSTAVEVFKQGLADPATPTVYIESMRLGRPTAKSVELKITLKKIKEGKSFGANSLVKTFNLDAKFGSDNKIEKCYSQLDGAVSSAVVAACSSIGGEINSDGDCVNNDFVQKDKICEFEIQIVKVVGGETKSCDPDKYYSNPLLHDMIHNKRHCNNKGGTVKKAGSASVCRLSGTSCPTGWTRYKSWGTTKKGSGSGRKRCSTSCTTGEHAWADKGIENCQYRKRKRIGKCRKASKGTAFANLTQ